MASYLDEVLRPSPVQVLHTEAAVLPSGDSPARDNVALMASLPRSSRPHPGPE